MQESKSLTQPNSYTSEIKPVPGDNLQEPRNQREIIYKKQEINNAAETQVFHTLKFSQARKDQCQQMIYTKQEMNKAEIQVFFNTIKFVQVREKKKKPKTSLPPAMRYIDVAPKNKRPNP